MKKQNTGWIKLWVGIFLTIASIVGLVYKVDKYNENKWNTKNCFQFSLHAYDLGEVPLRCKYQQIIYRNNEENTEIKNLIKDLNSQGYKIIEPAAAGVVDPNCHTGSCILSPEEQKGMLNK